MGQSSRDDEVEELEERVETLESKLQKMLPGRREVLAGGAAAGAAALGFGVGSASADGHNDGDTQWGSDSNRDDYVVDHLDGNSVSTDDIHSDSRVPTIVIREDSGTFYAVGQSGMVDSGTDPIPVLQSAVDTISTDKQNFFHAEGIVDGNGLTVSAEAQLQMGSSTVLRNISLDYSNSTADPAVTIDGSTNRKDAVTLRNVEIKNAPAVGLLANDMNYSTFDNVNVYQCVGNGVVLEGCIYNHLKDVTANSNRNGITLNANSAGKQSNHNLLSNCTGSAGTNTGIIIATSTGNLVQNCATENNDAKGLQINGDAKSNTILSHWSEQNSDLGIDSRGKETIMINPRLSGNSVIIRDEATIIGGDCDNSSFFNPDDGVVVSFWGTDPAYISEGTTTLINGWGDNDGDPSAGGAWNGNGVEGAAVVDTTNNTKYVYRGGAWV